MGIAATVEYTDTTVIKTYLPEFADRYRLERIGYAKLADVAPRLLDFDDEKLQLVVERHIPILYIDRADSVQYRQPLWELIQGVHDAGWWHRDTCLVNVVVDHGQPLLIDFENLAPATGASSYDLYGAVRVDAHAAWGHPYSVHWFNNCPRCPERYWRGL
ncbi:kinase [Mycobacterium phage Ariel]|uniref:kinase n=1 Tax=Mycobacterium phage Ariel TaxID=1541824 RepID=UPI0004F88A74|nr:kinase [Mycobacterium phage Ariel]AIM49893.1 serine/threonine kinase [Mycobacterium phage Ariel]